MEFVLGIGLEITISGQIIRRHVVERRKNRKYRSEAVVGKYFTSVYKLHPDGRYKSKTLFDSEGNFLKEFHYYYEGEEENDGQHF